MSRSLRSNSASSAQSTPPTTPDPGAAQFLHNLSQQQLDHLQYRIPPKDEPERFSTFLESPRQVPVPKRFTFDALNAASRLDYKEPENAGDVKRSETSQSRRSATLTVESWLKEVEKVKNVGDGHWRYWVTGVGLVMLNLVVAWDATAVSIALPSIATAVRGSALASFWLSTGFLAAATIFIQPFSVLSDIFGRKALLLAALTLFTIGAFVTAVSRVIAGLLIGRVIQGIGAGGIYALSSVIMTDLVSEVDRRNWNAIFGAIWALIAIVGPIIAGSLAQNGQWRWIFWINLPFCGLAFLIIPVFAQLKPALPGAKIPKLRSVDWFGHVLFGASLISILLGITWGGILHTWSSPATIASIVIGSVGFSMLFLWSWLSPFAPFVNIRPFLNITNLSVYLSAFLQGIVTFSALYFLPLYFQIAKPNISLAAVGTWLLPCSVALGLFALITFLFISIWTIWRPAVWVGWALLMVGVPSMALFTRTTENGIWIGITIMAGIGAGILFPSLAVALEVVTGSPSDVRQAREAVTNFTFVQTLGRTLGVAVSGTIFQNGVLNQLLDNRTLARSAERIAQNAVAHITVIHGWADGALRTGTQDAFIDSIRTIWIAMAAFAAVAFIGSLFMRSNPTKRRPATETNGLGQV